MVTLREWQKKSGDGCDNPLSSWTYPLFGFTGNFIRVYGRWDGGPKRITVFDRVVDLALWVWSAHWFRILFVY